MTRLGFLDQAMFKLEEGGMSPLYMCGAFILDTVNSPYAVDRQIVADHLAASLEEVPLMRQRLIQDPLKVGDLRLVDDPDFDVRNHITCSTLAAPGGYHELTEALENFSVKRMNLARPLWHCEVIDGLADRQIAVVTHIHHSILDGAGAMKALGSIWSLEPAPGRKPRSEPWRVARTPTPLELLSGAVLENAQRLYVRTPRFIWQNAGPILRTFSDRIAKHLRPTQDPASATVGKSVKVHKTSLNVAPLSAKRKLSYLELPLDEVKSLRKVCGCSINDLALLFNSFALEHYFASVGENIDFDLIAGMPVDLRAEEDTSAGNALAFSRVNLHNTVAGIRERLKAISDETAAIKGTVKSSRSRKKEEPGIDFKALSTLFSPLTLDALIYGIAKLNLMDKAAFLNVTIANVPGSQVPVYIAGAKIHSQIPMGPCMDSLALNITISSTEEYLIFGYHGCGEAVRDKELFVEGARRAFQSLKRSINQSRKLPPGKSEPHSKAKASATAKAGARSRPKSRTRPKAKAGTRKPAT